MKRNTLLLLILLAATVIWADNLKKLELEQVVLNKGESLYNSLPRLRGWADDNHYFQYRDNKLLKVHARTGKTTVMQDVNQHKILLEKQFNPLYAASKLADFSRFLFLKNNRAYLFITKEGKLTEVLKVPQSEGKIKNITLSPDGKKAAYTVNGDLYCVDFGDGDQSKNASKISRLTTDGSIEILNGYASWVYYEEILGRGSRYKAFWWSPDSKRIAFMRFDQTDVPEFMIYRAKGVYGYHEKLRYPKAGFPNPTVKIGIADIVTGNLQWIDYKDPEDHYLAFPAWNASADKLYFQWMNRGQDHLKIMCYQLNSKNLRLIYEEKQDAWVDFLSGNDFNQLNNGDFIFRSSRDGWYHIYHLTADGQLSQLTRGEWTVTSIKCINRKKKHIYFTAHKEVSTDTDLYRIDFKGKSMKRLTDKRGTHSVQVSPSGRYFIDRYSALNVPTRLELRTNRGKLIRTLGDSYSAVIEKYQKVKAELFRIKTEDGFRLPATWYLPPNLDKTDSNKKYPVVISIYGGPDSSIVSNSYGSSYRRGLKRLYLAQQGIIVMYVDNRASGHFGKKGMAMIHRYLGKWELYDYIQAVKYLETLPFVDKEKIGIVGHSYGGYMTALALTKGADYFDYGISGSPVTDWRLYDSVYTERYMDTPQENPEGYKKSSTMNYVDQYKGAMRLTHGTMDDNVHPQNSIQLLESILETGNTVEFMLYPGSRHGIGGKKRREYTLSNINFWLKHFFNRTVSINR
jgi:dipeptidyl-peptidase 4